MTLMVILKNCKDLDKKMKTYMIMKMEKNKKKKRKKKKMMMKKKKKTMMMMRVMIKEVFEAICIEN